MLWIALEGAVTIVTVTIVIGHVNLLREPGAVCLQYAAWQPVSFRAGLSAIHWRHRAAHSLPGEVIAGSGDNRCSDWRSAYGLSLSGTLIPECNGLSQFNEDTGKPAVPVREFNLIACPLAWSSWKTPSQTWIWTQAGKSHQSSRHCYLLTVVQLIEPPRTGCLF